MGSGHHIWDKAAAIRLLNDDRERSENAEFLKDVLRPTKQVIVDLGCGSGYYATKLKPFASMLYCIDSSEEMLSVARERVHGKNITFLKEDSSGISLSSYSVDIVFMANSFHDMEDKFGASAEIARILKPNGIIIVIDWKKGSKQNAKEHRGPPDSIRMSEAEYLRWFSKFKIKARFEAGTDHFGLVLKK
jgi:ubiquinone/menaquinone biosynthesis C-methylase UbiE